MISATLAQIGEFSFILAELGVALNLLPNEGRDLILAGAIISIMLNPLIFAAVDKLERRRMSPTAAVATEPISVTRLTDHVILVGCGRVGNIIADALAQKHRPPFVIEAADKCPCKLAGETF
jgi:monovalent cation:H+ antiporter-2, CPA2 family